MDNSDATREAAFSDFYRRELPLQVRRAFLMLGSNETANDVVHDAMIAVYERWGDLAEPGAYLNRSVLNGCRDLGRRTSTQRRLLPRVVRSADQSETEDPLDDVLAGLPFNHRAAVVLRYYADLSIADIAQALGCPQGSVGPWIDRALGAMRRDLTREDRS